MQIELAYTMYIDLMQVQVFTSVAFELSANMTMIETPEGRRAAAFLPLKPLDMTHVDVETVIPNFSGFPLIIAQGDNVSTTKVIGSI